MSATTVHVKGLKQHKDFMKFGLYFSAMLVLLTYTSTANISIKHSVYHAVVMTKQTASVAAPKLPTVWSGLPLNIRRS